MISVSILIKTELYHCPFEIGLCSGKGGHGRLGRVETGLLSRTLPIGTKGAERSTQARRGCAPLLKSKSKRLLVLNLMRLTRASRFTDQQ